MKIYYQKKFWEVHYLFSQRVLDRNAPNKFVVDWIMFKIKAKVLQNVFLEVFGPVNWLQCVL